VIQEACEDTREEDLESFGQACAGESLPAKLSKVVTPQCGECRARPEVSSGRPTQRSSWPSLPPRFGRRCRQDTETFVPLRVLRGCPPCLSPFFASAPTTHQLARIPPSPSTAPTTTDAALCPAHTEAPFRTGETHACPVIANRGLAPGKSRGSPDPVCPLRARGVSCVLDSRFAPAVWAPLDHSAHDP